MTIRGLKRANLDDPIDVARDYQEALDSVFGTDEQPPRRVPAVVLLDLKLPRVDGLDVLKRIRVEERTERIPVVMLISSSEDGDLIHTYGLGANSYPASGVGLPPSYNHGTLALLALAGLASSRLPVSRSRSPALVPATWAAFSRTTAALHAE